MIKYTQRIFPLIICIISCFAFDEAVKRVLRWIRKGGVVGIQGTLVLIVADHETGGMAISGSEGALVGSENLYGVNGLKPVWPTGSHTAVDTIIWSKEPGRKLFGKALDNTDLFWNMKQLLQ